MMNEAIINPSDICHRAFELIATKQPEEAEKLLLHHLSKAQDDTAIALYHSVLGVMCKKRGEYKEAWKHYSRAEKLLPLDPALKLISARLLLEPFAEFRQALKKAQKVLELIPHNPVFVHQAHITMGLAYLKKGDRKKAVQELQHAMVNDFQGFITAQNIDFHLFEALWKKTWGKDERKIFLEKALAFAYITREEKFIQLFSQMQTVADA